MVKVDFAILMALLVGILAILGWFRGLRAEAWTFSLVSLSGLLIGFDSTRERLVEGAYQLIRGIGSVLPMIPSGVILTISHRPVLALAMVGLLVAGAYLAGSAFGSRTGAEAPLVRLMGAVLGGMNGFALSLVAISVGRGYWGRGEPYLQLTLPSLQISLPFGRQFPLEQAPLIFIGGFFLLALLALVHTRVPG